MPLPLHLHSFSHGNNAGSDVWDTVNSVRVVANSDLKTEKSYALVGCKVIGAGTQAVRFQHNDFAGLTPMVNGVTDVNQPHIYFKDCPIFKGSSDLTIEVYSNAAEQPIIIPQFVEL